MPNPPANRKLIWILGLCAIGAAGLWRLAALPTEPQLRRAEPIEEPASLSVAANAVEPGSERAPAVKLPTAGATEAAPEGYRRNQLLRAFRSLELPRWMPPSSGAHNFDSTDMSSLRELVFEMGVEARELRGILDSAYEGDSNRPLVLAAFAFAKDVREEDRGFLLATIRSDLDENAIGRDELASRAREFSAFAGLFSLNMHGAEEEIEAVAEDLLPRVPAPSARHEPLRGPTLFALASLDRVSSPELLNSLRRIAAEPGVGYLTSAVWKALGRSRDANDRTTLLQQTEARNGFAREGLEGIRDPAMSPVLEQMIVSSDRAVYSQYVVASSARALLSIDSEESLAAFERVCLSPDWRVREAGLGALNLNPPTTALSTLLQVSAKARADMEDHPIVRDVDESIRRIRARMQRATVPHEELDRTHRGVREALPRLTGDHQALRAALEVIASRGDEADRVEFDRYMRILPEADREIVREAWAAENRTNAPR